jgi:hypothetical protein
MTVGSDAFKVILSVLLEIPGWTLMLTTANGTLSVVMKKAELLISFLVSFVGGKPGSQVPTFESNLLIRFLLQQAPRAMGSSELFHLSSLSWSNLRTLSP